MKFSQLQAGQVFKYANQEEPHPSHWEYRGNGFYGRPWSGGPYHLDAYLRATTEVLPVSDDVGRCPDCGAVRDGDDSCTVARNINGPCSEGGAA